MKTPAFLKTWPERFAPQKMLVLWYRHYKALFFILFLAVIGIGGWTWYKSLYVYAWNEEEKKRFRDSYVKETNFKEAKFQAVIDRLQSRMRAHEMKPEVKRNLFTGDRF